MHKNIAEQLLHEIRRFNELAERLLMLDFTGLTALSNGLTQAQSTLANVNALAQGVVSGNSDQAALDTHVAGLAQQVAGIQTAATALQTTLTPAQTTPPDTSVGSDGTDTTVAASAPDATVPAAMVPAT